MEVDDLFLALYKCALICLYCEFVSSQPVAFRDGKRTELDPLFFKDLNQTETRMQKKMRTQTELN